MSGVNGENGFWVKSSEGGFNEGRNERERIFYRQQDNNEGIAIRMEMDGLGLTG
jgi:hypothetical protein